MNQGAQKRFRSKYDILIWVGILSLILMGLLEYGFAQLGSKLGFWNIHLGMIPYAAWLVMTYIATRPKWFVENYNLGEMYKVHRILGIVGTVLTSLHVYVYFGIGNKAMMAWWTGYISFGAMLIAFMTSIYYLTPWFKRNGKSLSRKVVIWLHRFNLLAIITGNLHVHGFKSLAHMTPFIQVFDVVTYGLVVYYVYWMFKKRN